MNIRSIKKTSNIDPLKLKAFSHSLEVQHEVLSTDYEDLKGIPEEVKQDLNAIRYNHIEFKKAPLLKLLKKRVNSSKYYSLILSLMRYSDFHFPE